MEYFHSLLVLFCGIFVVSIYTWKFLNWVWFKPKKMEKSLRQQGFKGNSYRLFIGDYKELVAMEKEAHAKPIDFTNHIVPRVMPYINQSISKHGENCFVWFGPELTAIISDPEMIKEILSKNYVFQKPMHPITKLLAQGVAAYDTDKWAKHRNLIKPAFHLEKLKNMLPSFYLSCVEMLSKWENIVPSEGSYELDVWPYLQTLSSDAISRTAFGSSYEEGRKIFELQKQQGVLVLEAIKSISFFIPGWRFLPTKLNRRMKQNAKEIESSILQIINKKMRAIELGEGISDDLLGILLESNFNEIKQNGSQFGITMKEVIDECKLFYIAGQETTSSMLCWTMILLSNHLDWQSRAREEVAQVFGSEKPNLQELNHLKVISMIFHEVLRLYPPAVMLSRVIHKETTLGDVTLPAGLQLFLPTILLQHDPKYWGEDAKEFNPERFREGVSKATKEPLSYFPFGGGPRICIGQNFAMLEAKMAMAMILQQYSFELSPSYAHAPDMVLTLQSQYGAHIILHKL